MTGICKKLSWLIVMFTALIMLCGCESMRNQRTAQEVELRADRAMMREEQQRLGNRLSLMQEQIDDLWQQQEQVDSDHESRISRESQNLSERIANLEQQIQAIERARERDRKKIVDELTQTVTRLIAESQRSQQRGRASGYGREHRVGAGQTLSEIATAYGVTAKAIIDANEISNPNMIREGQVLFIPD